MTRNPVVQLDEIQLRTQAHGESFEAAMGTITGPMGADHLGARLIVVPPGKKAWPYHCHHGNDEMFIVLEGEGTLRFGGDNYPLKAGSTAVCPTGGPESAHQIINSGTSDLKYIAISSMREPDITEYPDSGKWAAFAGAAPGGNKDDRTFSSIVRTSAVTDYWDGEND